MFQTIFIIFFVTTLRVDASGMTEHLDKYLRNSKHGPARKMEYSMGYDNMHDSRYVEQEKVGFYYNDLVDREFARVNFSEPKITFVSNAVEVGNSTRPTHSFSAAQRSLIAEGINADRWDVKVTERGHQYFGLYNGNDTFVTNRLRAHILLWLINGIEEYLTIIDDESVAEDRIKLEKELAAKIKCIVERLAKRIKEDKFLFSDYEFGDYITPIFMGGSLVCVGHNYLVVLLMGDANVLLLDEAGVSLNLPKEDKSRLMSSYFLSDNYHIGSPLVSFIPRKYSDCAGAERRVKYLMLRTKSVATLLTRELIEQLVKDAQSNFKDESILTKMLAEDLMQKTVDNWSAQDVGFKNNTPDISFIVADLKY